MGRYQIGSISNAGMHGCVFYSLLVMMVGLLRGKRGGGGAVHTNSVGTLRFAPVSHVKQ